MSLVKTQLLRAAEEDEGWSSKPCSCGSARGPQRQRGEDSHRKGQVGQSSDFLHSRPFTPNHMVPPSISSKPTGVEDPRTLLGVV